MLEEEVGGSLCNIGTWSVLKTWSVLSRCLYLNLSLPVSQRCGMSQKQRRQLAHWSYRTPRRIIAHLPLRVRAAGLQQRGESCVRAKLCSGILIRPSKRGRQRRHTTLTHLDDCRAAVPRAVPPDRSQAVRTWCYCCYCRPPRSHCCHSNHHHCHLHLHRPYS